MFMKMKELTSQEWAILILFIVSIATLILTVQWSMPGEENNALTNHLKEEENVLTYNVSNH